MLLFGILIILMRFDVPIKNKERTNEKETEIIANIQITVLSSSFYSIK